LIRQAGTLVFGGCAVLRQDSHASDAEHAALIALIPRHGPTAGKASRAGGADCPGGIAEMERGAGGAVFRLAPLAKDEPLCQRKRRRYDVR